MTALASTRALLEHTVDYAGTFPPAALPLHQAVANYARERRGPEAWLLGRLVVHAGHLDELDIALPHTSVDQLELSVILSNRGDPLPRSSNRGDPVARSGTDAASQLARVDTFNQRWTGRARIASVEFPPTAAVEIPGIACRVEGPLEAFFEAPIDDELETRLDAISKAGVRAKVRTGGIVPAAIPTPLSLARFLHSCAERDVAFKATAGLHHAIRSCYSLTYERDSPTSVMHGFLNVSIAAMLAAHGAAVNSIVEALSETSATAFDFRADGLVYRDSTTALADLSATHRFFRSFGSCSFREPADELARLRLM